MGQNLLVPSGSRVAHHFCAKAKIQTLTVDTYLDYPELSIELTQIIYWSKVFEAKIRFISPIIFDLSLYISIIQWSKICFKILSFALTSLIESYPYHLPPT